MQAGSEMELRTTLGNSGLQLQFSREMGSNVEQPAGVNPPIVRQMTVPAAPVTLNRPTSSSDAIVHTKQGSDKQRFFLFSQLSSALRAGINPAEAFMDVSRRSAEQFRPSLEAAAAAATEGISISQVLERFPDLYPEHVIGTIRAAEAAGFLPDAMEEIAQQAQSAHAFGRLFHWAWFVAINALVGIPVGMIVMRAFVTTWQLQWDGNQRPKNAAGGLGMFFGEMVHALFGPLGVLILVFFAALYALRRYGTSPSAKLARHQLGLTAPVYGKRALQENLSRFSWTMAHVSKAGISPARAWQLAADSVPNLAFREKVSGVGQQLSGSEKMSDLVFRSNLFPDEYAPMVASAEYTGDLPGAMQKLSDLSAGEFVAAQNQAKIRGGCWMLLALFVTSGILLAMFFSAEGSIVNDIIKGMD